jgi:hypothetical protein
MKNQNMIQKFSNYKNILEKDMKITQNMEKGLNSIQILPNKKNVKTAFHKRGSSMIVSMQSKSEMGNYKDGKGSPFSHEVIEKFLAYDTLNEKTKRIYEISNSHI